jgi:purine-binding chemotaxis protein CheW
MTYLVNNGQAGFSNPAKKREYRMETPDKLVAFNLDEQRFALHLACVERVIRVVEITPLPKAPPFVLGIINMNGLIISVFDIRKRFRLAQRDTQLGDQMIVAYTSKRNVALVVDSASDVIEMPKEKIITSESVLPGLEYIEGVVKTEDGMIFIHDLERFLSPQEEKALNEAMEELNKDERRD